MEYIKTNGNDILVSYQGKKEIVNSTHKRFISILLEKNLREYKTYCRLVTRNLKIKTRIPVYIDLNTLLLPIYSPRNYDCTWINYFSIIAIYNNNSNDSIIIFRSGNKLEVKRSVYSLKRQIENAILILKHLF